MSDEANRKKYDSIYRLADHDQDFDITNLEKASNIKSFSINPGDFKYPLNKKAFNEIKSKIEYDQEFLNEYQEYEYMLGDLWEKENTATVKYIAKDFSEYPTNDNLFLDVNQTHYFKLKFLNNKFNP